MSIDYEPERQRYRVRWREAGRQRSRRFTSRTAAEAFGASLRTVGNSGRTGSQSERTPG